MMPVDGTVPMRCLCISAGGVMKLKVVDLLCLSLASSWFDDSVRLDVSWSGSESDSSLSGSLRECLRLPFELWCCESEEKETSSLGNKPKERESCEACKLGKG